MTQRRLQVVLDLDTGRYTGRMNQAAGATQKFNGVVNRSSGSVRNMSNSFDNLNRKMSTPLQKLRDYVLILGNVRLAILNVRDIAVGWVGALVQQSAQVERLTILMRGLSKAQTEAGQTAEAANNMRFLFAEARRTGFAVDALADAFVKMKSGGVDPTNGSLRALTNAVASFGGTSDTFHRASIAIQQMSGKGVISMEELRQQLGEAVPTAMMDMARAAGMSVKEFTDLVSKGVVQAGPALELMFQEWERIYDGAGERLAETFTGQMGILKTEMLNLANAFTGFNPDTQSAFDGSLYAEVTKQIRELNSAMTSSEGRAFAVEVGQAVADVARGIASTVQFLVEWRDEIGFIGKALVGVFVAVKGAQFFSFLLTSIGAAVNAMRSLSLSATQNGNAMAVAFNNSSRAITLKATALQRLSAIQTQAAVSSAQEVRTTQAAAAAATARVRALQGEQAALQAKVAAETANIRAAQQAQLVAQGNIANNIRLSTSIQQLKAAKTEETLASLRLGQAERSLATTKGLVTQATRVQTATTTANTAAIAREATANAAATAGLGTKAAAMGVAAAAARGLGMAINFALGPIGIFISLILSAAWAAGVFENRANRAAAAAARLAQGIATVQDMEDAAQRREQIRDRRERLLRERDSVFAPGTQSNYGPGRRVTQGRREEIARELSNLNQEDATLERSLNIGANSMRIQAGAEAGTSAFVEMNQNLGELRQNYSRLKDGAGTAQEIEAAEQEYVTARQQYLDETVASLNGNLAAALDRGDQLAASEAESALNTFKQQAGITDEQRQTTEDLRGQLFGPGGNPTGGGTGGGSVGGGARNQGPSREEREYASARNRYAGMLAQTAGDIAQLEAAARGAEGRLTEFNARVSAGLYADATVEELQAMAAQFQRIDELNEQANWEQTMGRLRDEVTDTTAEVEGLFDALTADDSGRALRDFERISQVRGQFAEQLEAAAGNPDRMNEVNEAINRVINNLDRMDAVQVADQWREMTEEIEDSFLSGEEARQQAFDREVERQRELLSLVAAGTRERQEMEARFYRWKAAAEERLRRENESSTTKLARDWAKLGSNIDTALGGAMDNFVDALADGELNFADFAASLIKELLKVILRALIAYAILSALGLANNSAGESVSLGDFLGGQIGGAFGGGSGTDTNIGFGASSTVPVGHIGGRIGQLQQSATVDPSVFAAAKRYHTGTNNIGGRALRPGEVPMIGMEGEAVLTEQHQNDISAALRAKRNGEVIVPPVNIQFINNSSTSLEAEAGEPEFNGREMIVSVVVEEAQREGPLRDVLRSAKGG